MDGVNTKQTTTSNNSSSLRPTSTAAATTTTTALLHHDDRNNKNKSLIDYFCCCRPSSLLLSSSNDNDHHRSSTTTASTTATTSRCTKRRSTTSSKMKDDLLSSVRIRSFYWQMMADKARTKYYIKRLDFFLRIKQSILSQTAAVVPHQRQHLPSLSNKSETHPSSSFTAKKICTCKTWHTFTNVHNDNRNHNSSL